MSSEDFKSLIVTDPDLVDEGIDVSGLRTTTDTSPFLLGNIPDYSGIQYDYLGPTKYSDLMRLYSQGLPMFDTPQAAAPVTTAPDTGDGGQATNFDPVSTPIIPIEPGTFTAESLDESFAGEEGPVTQPVTGGITSDPIEMENIMTYENPYQEPMDFDNPGASIENILQPNTPGTIGGAVDVFDINQTGDPSQNPGSTNVGDQPMAAGPFDYLQNNSISTIDNLDIFDSYAGVNDPQIGDPGFTGYTPSFDTPEQENTVQNIFGKVGQTVEGALTELGKIPGAIVDATNKTVDVFGKKIDIGKTLASALINKAAGAPISLILNALPEQDPRVGKLNEFYSTGEGAKYTDPNSPNYIPGLDQYNTVSGGLLNAITQGKYGTPTNYGLQGTYQKSIDTIEKTLADKYNMTDAEIADVKAGSYTGDVDSVLLDRIVNLEAAKKEEADMLGITAAEEKRLEELKFKDLFAGNIDDEDITTEEKTTDNNAGFDPGVTPGDSGFIGLDPEMDVDPFEFDDMNYEPPAPPSPPTTMSDISLADMPMQEFEDLINNVNDFGKSIDLIESRTKGQEYLDDLDEIGKGDDYIDYTEQEKADIAAGKKTPELGELIDFGLNSVSGNITPIDEFSDEAYMVGDTSTTTGNMDDVLGKMPDDKSDDAPTGVDAGTADVQDYFDDYSYSPDNDSGSQANIDTSGDFAGKGTGASGPAGGGGGSDPGGSKGCVIATHAVNSGAFTKDTKREAVRWCVKNLHRKWWGEAVRRGYKYYGQKAIEQGKAKNHYQEFKDYVAFGTGKRRTLKTGWTFVYRTVQFFLKGLTL